jgi:uncharacterized membrane protein
VLEYSKLGASALASAVEVCAAILIGLAAVRTIVQALLLYFRPQPGLTKEGVRLELGRWLALALEFELAADILRTAVAPTWNEIGQLAAIIVLRTALNFFLQQEIDKAVVRGQVTVPRVQAPPGAAGAPGPNSFTTAEPPCRS